MLELKQLRRYKSETLVDDDGKIKVRIFNAPIFYDNKLLLGDGVAGLRKIDNKLIWSDEQKCWTFLYNNYQPFIPEYCDDWFSYRDLYQGKDQTFGFRPVGVGHIQGRLVQSILDMTDQNAVVYDDAFGKGVDLIIKFTFRKMIKLIRIRDSFKPVGDTDFDFEMKFPEGMGVQEIGSKIIIGNDRSDGKDWFTRIEASRVWDSGIQSEGAGRKMEITPSGLVTLGEKMIFRKRVSAAFLSGSVGDVFTDATVNYYENKDTYYGTSFITGGDPDGSFLRVGGWGDFYYSYLEWDLAGPPTGEMVSEVLLSLKVQNVAVNDNSGTVRRVTSSWTEAGVTSSTVPSENATTRATLVNPVTIGVGNRDEQSILSLYQEWKNGASPNYGIKLHSAGNNNSQHNYHSSDAANSEDHPYLVLTLVDQAYTRGDEISLPSGTSPLKSVYSSQDKTDVGTDDDTRVDMLGFKVVLHQFKFRHTNNTDPVTVNWNGQASIAPSAKIVKLQIYNFNSSSWEDLDSDNTTEADTDFNLSGSITSSVANYYDDNDYVYVRVFQDNT